MRHFFIYGQNAIPHVAKGKNVNLSEQELELLKVINDLVPCSSEMVHEQTREKFPLLLVMRSLHALLEKGFLQRAIINNKQLYRTSRSYSLIKSFLKHERD